MPENPAGWLGQRLVRAKRKIREAGIPFEIPAERELPARLEAVLEAIYGAFGLGFNDAAGADARARDLADEAIWLEWHGHNAFIRDGERVFRTYFINNRGDEAMGSTWSYLDLTALGRQELWEDSPEGYPQTPTYRWWNWHDSYVEDAAPDETWVAVSDAGEAAFRKKKQQGGSRGSRRRSRR